MQAIPAFGLLTENIPAMLNLTIVLSYAALLIVVTSVITLRSRDPDPMLGGRNMPWWLVTASIIGTTLSSAGFLAIPAIGFTLGIPVILGHFVDPVVAGLLACFFFIPFLRKTRDASIYTLLRDRFGMGVSWYASAAFIIYKLFYAGIILCLVGKALHFIIGVDVGSIILVSGLLVIFYTYMTGIEGVMWTDFFQTRLLLTAGILALTFIASNTIDSFTALNLGWSEAKTILKKGTEGESFFGTSFTLTLFFFITRGISFFISDQTIAQRYLVARSDKHAKGGLMVAALLTPLIIGIFIAIGIGLYLFYSVNPQLASPEILADKDGIFAYFIANNIPNGLLGLTIIGILAAAMSTIDTGINSTSTVFYCNFWEPFTQKMDSKTLRNMSVMRNCSLIFGMLVIIAAYLIYQSSSSIINIWWKVGALFLNSLLGLFLLMRINKKAGKKSGITALIVGMAFITWATLTSDLDHPLASPFHYMMGLPVGILIMITVGLIVTCFVDETVGESQDPLVYSEEARQSIARKRKRAKKNIFADSLRPKSFYQVYAGIALAGVFMIAYDDQRMGFSAVEPRLLLISALALILAIIGPHMVRNFTSKRYLTCNLALLTIALPLVTSMTMFAHPDTPKYGYLFLASVMGLGTMVGWTMLSLSTMVSTAIASLAALAISPDAAVPDNWITLSLGTLGIFVFYAMDAAKAKSAEERALEKVHHILKHVGDLTMRHSIDLSQSGRQINMQDVSRLTHTANDIANAIDALTGATDTDPEDGQLELSVEESLNHALSRIPLKNANVQINCDKDFKVMGNRDVFENILYHLLDNATYYLGKGKATQVTCTIDAEHRIFSISNDGPIVKPIDVPYIFDLGYTTKSSLGLGLAYCKKMLEGMRAGIRLTSKPRDKWVTFKIYFPFSYDGRKLDDDISHQNEVHL